VEVRPMTQPWDAVSNEPHIPVGSAERAQSYPCPASGPQPYSSFMPPPTRPRNGLGIASLVIGIFALLSVWSVVGGLVLGGVAMVIGLVARGRVNRGEANNGGLAIAGIVLGGVATALGLIGLILVAIYGVLAMMVGSPEYQQCLNRHPPPSTFCDQYR
jgi:hypothetical protein